MFVLITENFWRIFWRFFWRRYLTPYKTPANDFKTFRYNFWMEFLILDHCEGVWLHCWWMDCQNQTMLSRRPSLGLFRGQETLCHIIFHNFFSFHYWELFARNIIVDIHATFLIKLNIWPRDSTLYVATLFIFWHFIYKLGTMKLCFFW